jgi:two-component system sensor histidine kinase/response regulator
MNGVVGMVDMLSDEIEDADHRDMLNTIKDSSYSLLAIIDDILDFSKIEANKLRLESVAFSIAENIENSLATLSSTAARTGIELVACIDPSLRRAVLGDPVRLRQILINLCGNAIKFTRGAKPVVVQAQATTMHDDSVSVEIKVIDTGVGISREAQPNLFEPFSQAEASTTRKFGGTGLGLSICHRLTQLMAGEIGVRSTLGEGSEFWVRLTFPLTTQTQPTPPPPTLAGVRVVVISTVPSIHQACELNLEHHGATVIRARTAIARQFSPDDVVVLTDPLEVEDQVRDLCGRPDAQRPKTVAVIPPSHRASVVIDASAVRVRGNPIRHDDLLHSIARAAGRATGQTDFENDPTRVKAASRISLAPAGSDAPIILVAEDNTTNQAVIKRQLRVLGYDCEMAADGREALNLWLERRHRVVLTDLHMPEMDGFELTKAIRAHEALGGPVSTIAAVTASASTSEADRCREAGIDDCLFKPLEIGVLQRSLKRWTNAQDTSPSARAPTTSAPIELTPAKSAPVESAPVESAPVKSALVESAAKDHGAPCSAGPAVEHVTDEQPTPPNHSTSLADIAKSQIEKILRAADVGDSALVKTNTVSLKSAAEHSGHPPLVAACDRLLEAAEADDWPNLSRLLGTLPEALDARSEQRRPPGLNA